jgi:glycosyltransferase involved in cell wall biosynthesis
MKLSIVVPVNNEDGTVVELLRLVQGVELAGKDCEVIVIDDGSSDGTLELLRNHPQLYNRLLVHERDQGKRAALRTWFAAVTGNVVLIQNANLELDPRAYPKLLQPIASGRADIVLGSRYLARDSPHVSYLWHTLIDRRLTLLTNMLTNLTLTAVETCYKVIRTELARQLNL